MAAIFKVKLEDDYTAKAKKIADSTSQMESAMSKVGNVAKKTGSVLKSSLDRKYKVDIKETGSKYLESRVSGLKKTLGTLNKPYDVKITAKMSRLDKVKSSLSEIKSKATGVGDSIGKSFGKVKKLKVDYSTFRQAKKEAKQLSKEISAFTGKKHKVQIDMENPIKGFMSKMKSGLSAGFGKLNPMNWFGRGKAAMPTAAPPAMNGGGGGGLVGSIVKGSLITGAIQKGLGALKSGVDATLGAGMNRLENIQSAKARLRGQTKADGSRAYSDRDIKNISKSAMDAVTGTAYGFGDAMTVASSAIASGVNQKNVGSYLKDIANISAATGSDFNEIGAIMNKIQTTGKLQGDELMQLSDKGLPILSKIAEIKGVDDKTAREMISKGAISSEDAFKAASMAAGNSATEMGQTREAAKMNFQAALSKLGAGLLGGSGGENDGIFGVTTSALLKVNDVLNDMVPTFQKFGDKLGGLATGAIDKVKSGFGKVSEFFQPAMEKFREGFTTVSEKLGQVIDPLKEKLSSAFEGLKEAFSPLIESISGLFGNVVEGNFSIFTTMIDLAAQGLSFLADAIMIATPVIQSIAEWISANIIPAISEVVSWVSGTLIPAISDVVSTIMGALIPIFQTVADFIGSYVVPAFEVIANTILSVAEPVFHVIASAVEWATDKFNDLVGAVGSAVDALLSIPEKIASMVGNAASGLWDKVTSWIPGNATGTSYFGGGMTRVNERGEEMIQLARGDKIYPSGKTDRIIEKQINNRNQNRETKNITLSPTININGANKNGQEIAKEVNKQLKRLAVNI